MYEQPFYATWDHSARGRLTSDQELTGIVFGKEPQVPVRLSARKFWYEPYATLLTRKQVCRKAHREAMTLPLPENMDGSWQLSLNLVPDGNRLSGTAFITYSNGQTNGFRLRGSYYPRKEKYRVLLTGQEADCGASLSLWLVSPGMGIESLSGVVAGQRLRWP